MVQPITISKNQSAATDVVIKALGVCKSFGSNHVLRQFSLQLHRGENVVILGRSGSGKSVFIKCVIGLLTADEGTINVLGEDILQLRQESLDRLRARIGFLFQSNALYDSMTVRENLEFPLRRHWLHGTKMQATDKVKEVLEQVGLPHTAGMMPAQLSGGMRKRIALARTLIVNPEIMLYDEPTTGLDPITGKEITDLMLALGKQYSTSSIIISHDMKCIERVANRIILLHQGKAYAEGNFDDMKRSKDPVIKGFFE